MEILDILNREKGQTIDFESILVEPETLAIHIVAMANAEGGLLAIGISGENHLLEGVDQYEDRVNVLKRVPLDLCVPAVRVRLDFLPCVDVEGKENRILLMHIPASILLQTNKAGECYLRVGEESKLLSPEESEQLRQDKKRRCFDDSPVHNEPVKEINFEQATSYLREMEFGRSEEQSKVPVSHDRRVEYNRRSPMNSQQTCVDPYHEMR